MALGKRKNNDNNSNTVKLVYKDHPRETRKVVGKRKNNDNNSNTVKLVYKDHPRETRKVVRIGRRSLLTCGH